MNSIRIAQSGLLVLLFALCAPAAAQFAAGPQWSRSMDCKKTPLGPVKNNASVVAYKFAVAAVDCDSEKETRVCHNAVLSGSFAFSSCKVGCVAPWGYMTEGASVVKSLTCGQNATRKCIAGVVVGNAAYRFNCSETCVTISAPSDHGGSLTGAQEEVHCTCSCG